VPWTATNSEGYPAPVALAVDVVVLTVREGMLSVLVTVPDDGPFALPGGFVGPEEDPLDTARRKLEEKTGLRRPGLEQLATFAVPGRDARGWIPTVAHLALVPSDVDRQRDGRRIPLGVRCGPRHRRTVPRRGQRLRAK